ncbi:6175_t:CDS:2, partial [Diversispora eburnea]
QTSNENIDDNNNYEYFFNRTYQKVCQIIKTKSEITKTFYILLNKTLQEEITNEIQKVPEVLNNGQIKNPLTIKSKDTTCNFVEENEEKEEITENLSSPLPEKIRSLLHKISNQNGKPTSEDRETF